MASSFVSPTVGRLTCRGGKNPVRCFHTPKSCPLLLRLALFLVSGFVGPSVMSVGRLTCRSGKNPVRSFHTPNSCPLLLRLALFLVFRLCVWKWTTSGEKKGTSRQRSGKGAIRKRFPLQKPRWEKTKLTIRYLYHETYRKIF